MDSPEQHRAMAASLGIEYRVLSDPTLHVADLFGVRHVEGAATGDIARPAEFLLDRTGRVVWRDLTDNWRVRVRPEELLRRLAEIP